MTASAYRKATKKENRDIILEVLKKIDSQELQIAGKDGKSRWQKDWQKILTDFSKNRGNISQLTPQFLRKTEFFRFNGDYIKPKRKDFYAKWQKDFKTQLFRKYLKGTDNIYEFECGTGHNLVLLASLFPKKQLFGLDWVKPSADLVSLVAKRYGYKLTGRVFDLFAPDQTLNIPKKSGVLTVHSLEQVGTKFGPFLNFILNKKPDLCINIEPLYEMYDKNKLSDYLAIAFHKKRNYLTGYLPQLLKLEKEKKIKIIEVKRMPLGSFFHDSYSYIVWKPIKE